MDEDYDYDNGFRLGKHSTPCCNALYTLHDLVYEWPQGFGRFALEARNPGIGKLDGKYKREFEDILGAQLRVIYRRL
jgi:hypothetical protein